MGSEASYATSALSGEKLYSAKLAKLSDPKQKLGLYWGYQTRIASCMRELLEAGPYEVGGRTTCHSMQDSEAVYDCSET